MKRKIILLIFICFNVFALKAQNDSVKTVVFDDSFQCGPPDYIIMINGKLPLSVKTYISFDPAVYKDTITYDFYYNFKRYSYGSVWWSDKCPDLCSIIPDSAKVYLEFQYREAIGWNRWKDHSYRDTLSWGGFYGVEFVNINDINKKDYYINYILQPPWKRLSRYDGNKYGKSRRAYRRFYKKITRGWFPSRYTDEGRPIYF